MGDGRVNEHDRNGRLFGMGMGGLGMGLGGLFGAGAAGAGAGTNLGLGMGGLNGLFNSMGFGSKFSSECASEVSFNQHGLRK